MLNFFRKLLGLKPRYRVKAIRHRILPHEWENKGFEVITKEWMKMSPFGLMTWYHVNINGKWHAFNSLPKFHDFI